ncbi:MAG TPA: C4-type zinc ribbon domain-containing protein [Acidimicrobiia bacterium]|nr:C4-type zinc ribbon domain-containing protein [Acidimicrobiia bacterium]
MTAADPRLEALLRVQEQDTVLDQLRHRRATLPARAELAALEAEQLRRDREVSGLRTRRDEILVEERRFDDEAQTIAAKAKDVDAKLYSGTIASPRELQALQADLEMLHRRRRELEDHELEQMEAREAVEGELTAAEAALAETNDAIARTRAELASGEAEIDAEVAREAATRHEHASGVPPEMVADYEQRRVKNRGFGIARLVGDTCQACHLSIPATEVERIRRTGGDPVASCDNCGAILVP